MRTPRFSKSLAIASKKPEVVSANLANEVSLGRIAGLLITHTFEIFKFLRLVWSAIRNLTNSAQSFINYILHPAQPALIVVFQNRTLVFSMSLLILL